MCGLNMVGIGFFAPLPLALMMPFMAGQSMMMGDAFGKAYQYGKRKISAMTNEEFNKLTTGDLGREILTDYTAIIPSMTQAIKQSTTFQSFIIHELAEIVKNLPKDLVEGLGVQPTSPQAIIQNYRPPPANEPSGLVTQQDLLNIITGLIPSIKEAGASHGPTVTPVSTTSSITDTLQYLKERLAQAEADKNIHGPTLTQKTIQQTPNTLRVNPDGSLTNIDIRGTSADTRKITLPSVQSTVTSRRKAGQSQINEQRKLKAQIINTQYGLKNYNLDKHGRAQMERTLKTALQQLANLQARYRF